MSSAFKKAESIRKVVKTNEIDPIFGKRDTTIIYGYLYQPICNRLNGKIDLHPMPLYLDKRFNL
jgi:hypothetical protein